MFAPVDGTLRPALRTVHVHAARERRRPRAGTGDRPLSRRRRNLAPLRDYFHAQCGAATGLSAAECLQDAFVIAFPHGSPRAELFDDLYDPVSDLQRHLAGEPGHCVTRSGIEAAILLSVGTPARVVQLFAGDAGHTLVELWDPHEGWVLFDPTVGAMLAYSEDRTFPPILSGYSEDNHWRLLRSGRARGAQDLASIARVFAGASGRIELSLPEPWLYTRSGERQAMWPFRAETVQVGALYFSQGPLQHLLRALIVVSALVCVAALARLFGELVAARRRLNAAASTRSSR